MARQFEQRSLHGVRQVAVVVERYQMRDDFSVRLGAALDHVSGESPAELQMVLDDPIEHDPDPATGIRVGVSVGLGDTAMRRPARVSNPDLNCVGRRGRHDRGNLLSRADRECGAQRVEVADRSDPFDHAVLAPCESGRVIAAVFQPLEPLQQDLLRSAGGQHNR